MSTDNQQPTGCDTAPQEVCGIPDGGQGMQEHVPAPPCPPPAEPPQVPVMPYVPPCAEPPLPLFCMPEEITPCRWDKSCAQSVPPAIGCPPILTGWGSHNGGVPAWARKDFCEMNKCREPHQFNYTPKSWESVLDLNTSSHFWSNLAVYRNNQIQHISAQQFISLAHKIFLVGAYQNLFASPDDIPDSTQMALGYVVVGADAGGRPIYGLSNMYQGQPYGAPIPLQATRNSSGVLTALNFPIADLVAAEAP